MSNLILIGTFFIALINFVLLINISSHLIDIQADLYYYYESDKEDEIR